MIRHPYPNGTRVRKINSRPGDAHENGALATVVRYLHHPDVGTGYFLRWDDMPHIPEVFIEGSRLEPA